LAFYLADHDIVDGQEVRVAEFVGCTSVVFPNDEALHGHRLWGKGLEFYALHQVVDSEWLRELRNVERVHERASDAPFPHSQHFVLTFHDSTLEAVAVVSRGSYPSMTAALMAMASS
jgi:hypothetical protein